MPVHLHFTFTFEDYFKGQLLYAKSGWWTRMNYFLARIGAPILGAVILAGNFWLMRFAEPGPFMIINLSFGLFFTLYPLYFRFKLKRCYLRTRTGSGERTLDFNNEVIKTEEANAKSELNWAVVRSFSEDKDTFLLYLAPAKMVMIPKRICSESQLTELRDMLQRNISKATS
jgi:hypothetical protein